jgi:methyl-accepting chemotaxis protein
MQWFSNLRISSKLLACFGLVALFAAIAGLVGAAHVRAAGRLSVASHVEHAAPLAVLAALDGSRERLRGALERLAWTEDGAERTRLVAEAAGERAAVERLVAQLDSTVSDSARAAVASLLQAHADFLPAAAQAATLGAAGRTTEVRALLVGARFGGAAGEATRAAAALRERLVANAAAGVAAARADGRRGYVALSFVVVLAVVAAVGQGLWLARHIGAPLQQLGELAAALTEGDAERKMSLARRDELGWLAYSFNQLAKYQRSVAEAARRLSEGDVTVEVEPRSERDVAGHALRQLVQSLRGVTAETATLTSAARAGRLDVRGDAAKFRGGFQELVAGVNATLDGMQVLAEQASGERDAAVRFLDEAGRVLDRVAERDLTVRMSGEYAESFARVKETLNTAVENLDAALGQVGAGAEQVAAAAVQIAHGSQSLAQGTSAQSESLAARRRRS